jgi:hypothetical protein
MNATKTRERVKNTKRKKKEERRESKESKKKRERRKKKEDSGSYFFAEFQRNLMDLKIILIYFVTWDRFNFFVNLFLSQWKNLNKFEMNNFTYTI